MPRKYTQQGYQDNNARIEKGKRKQEKRSRPEGPRSPLMPGFQEVMRCAMCGYIVPSLMEIKSDSRCPKCNSDLRTCKHCHHFDTSAQFECNQPILERVMKKDLRTDCEFFDARTSVEKETTSPIRQGGDSQGGDSPKDARSAFDDLFR